MSSSTANRATTVFLSYAHEDQKLATLVREALRESGWTVWTADEVSAPGERWAAATYRALRDADVVVPLLTKAAVSSSAVQMELAAAIAQAETSPDKHILPVLVDEGVKPLGMLAAYQWLRPQSHEPDSLVAAIRTSLERLRPTDRELDRTIAANRLRFDLEVLERARSDEQTRTLRRDRFVMATVAAALVLSSIAVTIGLLWADVHTAILVAIVGALQASLGAALGWLIGFARKRNDG